MIKTILTLAAVITLGALFATGGVNSQTATVAACTNQLGGLTFNSASCTNNLSAYDCTNKFSLEFVAACPGCTNKLTSIKS